MYVCVTTSNFAPISAVSHSQKCLTGFSFDNKMPVFDSCSFLCQFWILAFFVLYLPRAAVAHAFPTRCGAPYRFGLQARTRLESQVHTLIGGVTSVCVFVCLYFFGRFAYVYFFENRFFFFRFGLYLLEVTILLHKIVFTLLALR